MQILSVKSMISDLLKLDSSISIVRDMKFFD